MNAHISITSAGAVALAAALAALGQTPAPAPQPVGAFDNHADVGVVLHKGSAAFDAPSQKYTLTGSGDNVWGTADGMHFVWKRLSGNMTLSADIAFPQAGGAPHRKAMLMVRQNLDGDSPYADIAIHGDGMASLQAREAKGATTHQLVANRKSPKRVSIRRLGNYFLMSVAGEGEELHPSGGSLRVLLTDPVYVGIAVSAHDKDDVQTATFSNVELLNKPPTLYSTLETITVSSQERHVVYTAQGRFEAPNWTPDGKALLFNGGGHLQKISSEALAGAKPEVVDTGFATRLNNDHGISPDGTMLAISDNSQDDRHSIIYTLPIGGGTPKRLTKDSGSYWHGWSPDGKTIVFTGFHDNNYDVWTIPAAGGDAKRLTFPEATDDGPEYSRDGKYIYFNSARTGIMQIWRMNPDGTGQEQITNDEYNNWFPHFSPDGKQMVMVSFDREVPGHPEDKDVILRIMDMSTLKITPLTRLLGGQGTINVPSWAPDGRRLAFVSYQLIP